VDADALARKIGLSFRQHHSAGPVVVLAPNEASTGAPSRPPRVRPSELKQFLANSADVAKTKPEIKEEAKVNFQGKTGSSLFRVGRGRQKHNSGLRWTASAGI
jgi:hypothetical protein